MYKKVLASGVTLSMLLVGGNIANAEDSKVNDDVFIKGANLDSQQLDQTKKELGVGNNFKEYSITTDDVAKYTGNNSLDHIYSSATIEPKTFGKGVSVEIKTPDNITRITKEQYTNAAISAGVQNSDIKVASIESVTGEGALSGIYKAYEKDGDSLNQNDISNANKEMDDLANISDQNKGQKGYSDEALNNTVAETKSEIAKQKQDNGDLSNQEVSNILDDKLKQNGLNKVLSDEQVNTLDNNMNNVANSKAMNNDPKAYQKQADKLASGIKSKAGNLIDKAKDLNNEHNRNILQRIWDTIVNFFKWLYNSITSIFNL